MLTQTVDIITPGTAADPYGDTVPDWGAGASHSTTLGFLQQVTSTEDTVDRDTVVSTWRLFLSADAPIAAKDRIVVVGRTFEVVGVPDLLTKPRGGPHHIEAVLVSVDG